MVLDSLPKDTYKYSHGNQDEKIAYVCESSDERGKIEPFDDENEALDFINFYSRKVINEEG
ncbi:MAG: hypothetical protein FWD13_12145 [Treponema sp.]|nr:hypothetical protein [Treponema sp.]